MSNRSEGNELKQTILSLGLKDAAERASILSYFLSAIFAAYGFTSFDFIHRFNPLISFWDNLWPRLIFNSLPLILLGSYLRKSKLSGQAKCMLWITGFSVILHGSSWIHIWQAALWRSPEILTYVHAANTYLFAVIYGSIAPPRRILPLFTLIFLTVFVFPLWTVAYLAGDSVILGLTIGDSVLALSCSVAFALSVDKLRCKIAQLELEKQVQASQFLGPLVSRAIFENDRQVFNYVRCKGYILTLDIRDSTELQKELGPRWHVFRKEYFTIVSKVVADCGGYIQKTIGDGHVINFGVMDFGADLSDIPGIEEEQGRAEERRLQRASDAAFRCVDMLHVSFLKLVQAHFQDRYQVRLGAGLDKGFVERGIQGDAAHLLELDVNGDPVNCSNRLQDFSKAICSQFDPNSSLLIISPFAADYLQDYSSFRRLQTLEKRIRNYPGIKWVLVKEYRVPVAQSGTARAA